VRIWHSDVVHEEPVDARSWLIGLDSWIIQDGNYPDIVTGQRIDFALEFASRGGLRRSDEAQEAGVRWIEGSQYEVTAQVVHDEPNARVLDFGILAYHFIGVEDPEHQSHVGCWVTGEINLSVDPFFYFQELASEDGFPPLIYAWTVQEVLQRTGQNAPRGGATDVLADKRHGFTRIEKTDAWGDVSTAPGYLLRCRREPAPRSAVRSVDNR
jgi:hypothetical protein